MGASQEDQERQRRRAALQMIELDIGRLIRQAEANNLPMLAYMLDMAQLECRSQLREGDNPGDDKGG